jgi:hypothetical protein
MLLGDFGVPDGGLKYPRSGVCYRLNIRDG